MHANLMFVKGISKGNQLQITDFGLPITNYELRITNFMVTYDWIS